MYRQKTTFKRSKMQEMLKYFKNIGFNEIVSSGSLLAKAVAGALLVCLGGAIMLVLLFLPQSWLGSNAGIFSFAALLALLLGIAFILWAARSLKKLQNNLLEKKTLQIAKKNGGILTVAQLALQLSVSTSIAEKLLKQMQHRGVAEVGANENGAVCFKFYDLMT